MTPASRYRADSRRRLRRGRRRLNLVKVSQSTGLYKTKKSQLAKKKMTFLMFGLRSDSARLQAYWNCFIILSPISVQDPLDNIKRCLENFDTGAGASSKHAPQGHIVQNYLLLI